MRSVYSHAGASCHICNFYSDLVIILYLSVSSLLPSVLRGLSYCCFESGLIPNFCIDFTCQCNINVAVHLVTNDTLTLPPTTHQRHIPASRVLHDMKHVMWGLGLLDWISRWQALCTLPLCLKLNMSSKFLFFW